jgi:hypothetical protein
MAKLKVVAVKKIWILIILFGIFLIGCFPSARHSKPLRPDPDSFRGIRWGTEISMLSDMQKVEENQSSNPDSVWYTREGDTLAMGQAKLKDIFYSFWKGKFDSVWIDFEGEENFEALKKELFERFGEVFGSDEPMEKAQRGARRESSATKRVEGFYTSWGKNTEMLLSYSKDRHKGTLTINSAVIGEERRAYETQKEKEERLRERGF